MLGMNDAEWADYVAEQGLPNWNYQAGNDNNQVRHMANPDHTGFNNSWQIGVNFDPPETQPTVGGFFDAQEDPPFFDAAQEPIDNRPPWWAAFANAPPQELDPGAFLPVEGPLNPMPMWQDHLPGIMEGFQPVPPPIDGGGLPIPGGPDLPAGEGTWWDAAWGKS